MFLAHERLDAYRLALDLARWAASAAIPPQRKHLREQLVRAADGIVLGIAEGSGLSGDARRHHHRIALGSKRGRRCRRTMDLLAPCHHAAIRDRIVRVAAMLSKMARR